MNVPTPKKILGQNLLRVRSCQSLFDILQGATRIFGPIYFLSYGKIKQLYSKTFANMLEGLNYFFNRLRVFTFKTVVPSHGCFETIIASLISISVD